MKRLEFGTDQTENGSDQDWRKNTREMLRIDGDTFEEFSRLDNGWF